MSTTSSSDRQTSRSLLARVQSNDAAAWDRLVVLYAPFVLRCCRRPGLADHDVADIFQEVFHATLARIRSFEQGRPGATFRGWLRTIARNKVNDHFRRLRREPQGGRVSHLEVPLPPDREGDEERDEGAEILLLRSAMELVREHFEERTWRAFRATALDGRSPKDVAEDLGTTPGAVRVAKSRVLSRLRLELGDLPSG